MAEEEKKNEEIPMAGEDDKKPEETARVEQKAAEPPPAPPREIVLRVFMHCEGCARKVRRCLDGFPGVEEVITDCKTSKVVVKGDKADPVKVLERLQKKSHRKVELIYPTIIPKTITPGEELLNKPQPQDDKKDETVVVLGVFMHCEACAQEIKRRIHKMKGVVSVEPNLKSNQVIVKGVIEPEKLVAYVYKRIGKHVTVVKVDPGKKEEKEKEKEENKPEECDKKDPEKGDQDVTDEKKGGGGDNDASGGSQGGKVAPVGEEVEEPILDLRKQEFYNNYPHYYHQKNVQEINYSYYPPHMFSDENPNACNVM